MPQADVVNPYAPDLANSACIRGDLSVLEIISNFNPIYNISMLRNSCEQGDLEITKWPASLVPDDARAYGILLQL